jgi:hypothetical protein
MRNSLFIFLVFCLPKLYLFADTYVWEDYDDFSGSSLDTNKWGTMYLGGGIEPYVLGGKLVLSAGSGNPSATKVVKTGWEDIFQGDEGGEAWVYAKDSSLFGIEAEFVIPSSASSRSCFQLGVASLNPLSFLSVELNADPSSSDQYSQGFAFYHTLSSGQEIEQFDITQRDKIHKLAATLIDGRLKLLVDGVVKYEADSETFNTDMFIINGFNDYNSNGLAFELEADNVRVLRRSTTTSLDGSTYSLSSSDGVSETLVFANGTFTSTFTDPEEGEIVTTDQSYILDQVSEDEFRIILGDGDTMEFNTATKSGKLTDYDSSGQIDTSGTWDFTFETISSSTVAISDPNGQPVVVQVGDDYQWNDTLDGVMLWGVWQDDDTNEWVIATVNYIGGRQKGAKGSYSSLPNELDVDHPYIVDGDTIDVTETNGHQYYQVTSVENGIIYAVDGDGAPLTDLSWWFTTLAAAEEFYNLKAGYPMPQSWQWFDHYPWVYSSEDQDWMYYYPRNGKLMIWSNKEQSWRTVSP